MLNKPFIKILSSYLIIAVIALSLPAPGWAMFLPSGPAPETRAVDLARIQTTLESKAVQQRLLDYGLSPAETSAKLNALSNEQVHRLATNLDAIQPGADAVGDVLFILLVVAIVIVVLEATGHHIIIKR